MAWLKIDDGWYMHPKIRAAGRDARDLWMQAACWCAQQENDGEVPDFMLAPLASLAELPADAAHPAAMRLVGLGLWEDSRSGPGWVFHDWHVYQPKRAALLARRKHDRRKKELHSKTMEPIRLAARERDGESCRYCGTTVIFDGKGSRGPHAATFDHVDPAGSNDLDNVVVACLSCNSRKKDRAPAEVGMTLRPSPAPPTLPTPPKGRATPARPPAAKPSARTVPAKATAPSPRSPRRTTPPPSPLAPANTPPRRRPTRSATGPPA
jgi:5-methylcytosine-specific restriction endonuclease McrA